jgi:hypothetical protein
VPPSLPSQAQRNYAELLVSRLQRGHNIAGPKYRWLVDVCETKTKMDTLIEEMKVIVKESYL